MPARATERWANQEAIGDLTRAAELCSTLPATPDRTRQEVDVYNALGHAQRQADDYPRAIDTFQRAAELARQVGGGASLTDKDDKAILFNLKSGRHTHRYYQHKGKKRKYCYTPWADTKGRYWAFDITGRGTVVKMVQFSKRKTADARALSRYTKAGA